MNFANKASYKSTEFGIIPDDWNVISLGEIIIEFRGGAPLKPSDFISSGVKVLPKGGVGKDSFLRIDNQDIQYCSDAYFMSHKSNQVDNSYTVVVLRDLVPSGPSIGYIVQIRDKDKYILAQGVYGFKTNGNTDPRYLVHISKTPWYRQIMNATMVGSTQVHITNTAFKSVRLPLPPTLAEQQAIAEALSDTDTLIETLEQLITKKRKIKQGAMQELLTGKRRLPGFSGEWEVKSFGDLFAIHGGLSASRENLGYDGFCYLHYGDIHTTNKTFIDVENDFLSIPKLQIPIHKVSPNALLKNGDIVFVDASEDEEGASKHVVVVNASNIPFISGLHTIVAKRRTDEIDPLFCRYCFQTRSIKDQFRFFAVGTKVSGVSKGNIVKINLSFPLLFEQTAIATILSDMDAEITELEQKLSKARQVKQGMMQELLTGRIRLV